jgi:hypothetical protein
MQMLETLRQTGVVPNFYAVAYDRDESKCAGDARCSQ